MKQLLFFLTMLSSVGIQAQNVGINTIPTSPLTVLNDVNGNGIVHENNTVRVGFSSGFYGTALKTLSNHNLYITTNNSLVPEINIATNKNMGIGIGINEPEYKLDLRGRMRLQHSMTNNQTAGIWFDGTTLDTRSFWGTLNDDHTGIWGNGGANWNFVMNVNNGNTGIGTTAPTATLDVNGTVRFRGAFPQANSVLIATDANGNTAWQSAAGFHASGGFEPLLNIPANTWVKYYFKTLPEYNNGVFYNPTSSQFVAPYKGIYHFGAHILFEMSTPAQGIALKGLRNGTPITYEYKMEPNGSITISGTQYNVTDRVNMQIVADVLLEAGDIVWVEVYSGTTNINQPGNFSPWSDWFTGSLITRLQ